jgi:hypothetical protein
MRTRPLSHCILPLVTDEMNQIKVESLVRGIVSRFRSYKSSCDGDDDVPIVSDKIRAVLWFPLFDPLYVICALDVDVLRS